MPAIQRNGTPTAASAASYDRVGTFPLDEDESTSAAALRSVSRVGPAWLLILLRNPHLAAFYDEHCAYLPPMAGWFLFSSLLSSYNKLVFGKEHMNFPCPLLLTSMHFCTQWAFSLTMCRLFPVFFGSKRVSDMTWPQFLEISVPCGLVTSADIGLSNLSLVTISITFYTMVKASTPIFVLIWAYFFGIMKIKCSLIGVIFVIAVGEYLTVVGEVDFILNGFLLCLMASILSGARWTLVQLKIQSLDPPLKTTVATMRVLSPFMAISMILVSLAVEQPWNSLQSVIDSWGSFFNIFLLGLLGACLAVCMIMCEFFLIMHTNAIVLMIGGVIKEILTIFIGVNFFGDKINLLNVIGCCVVFMGVILYKVMFHLEKKEEEAKQAETLGAEVLGAEAGEEDQEERSILKDKSEPDMNGYKDEDPEMWKGLQEGIEMRRSTPLRSNSGESLGSNHSTGESPQMLIV